MYNKLNDSKPWGILITHKSYFRGLLNQIININIIIATIAIIMGNFGCFSSCSFENFSNRLVLSSLVSGESRENVRIAGNRIYSTLRFTSLRPMGECSRETNIKRHNKNEEKTAHPSITFLFLVLETYT